MASLPYRSDIDGMRAIAVMVVLLFHLDIHALAGGFVGVDVFFVISGFLITSIIWNKSHQGRFSLKDFYFGRIRRLFPALYATVFLTFIASVFILNPMDFASFARSCVAALFSVSNILFYLEAGYWDASSHLKPLLHTWSLGVEEQFYLVWPLFVLMCASWLKRIPFLAILIFVSAVSLAVTLWYSQVDISGAFYLFPFRIFQFSLGAVVAFGVQHKIVSAPLKSPIVRDILMLIGLAIIICCVFAYGDETPFPDVYVIPPTIGTMLMLYAGSGEKGQGPIGTALLSNPVSLFLGRISYVLYLVHWPVIVLYRYETGLHFTWIEQVAQFVVMFLLAVLIHYTVERRFYRRDHARIGEGHEPLSAGGFAFRTIAIGLVASAIGLQVYFSNGWVWRFPSIALTPEQVLAGKSGRFENTRTGCSVMKVAQGEDCNGARSKEWQLLVLGNSHEPDGYNFFNGGYGQDPRLNLISFGTLNGCAPEKLKDGSWKSADKGCQRRLNTLFDPAFVNTLDGVVYASNRPFAPNKDGMAVMLEELKSLHEGNLAVIVYGGYINTGVDCANLVINSGTTDACKDRENVTYFEDDPKSQRMYDTIMGLSDAYVDRVELHCPDRKLENCETRSPEGIPFAYDQHHASLEFAEYGGRQYAQAHPDLLEEVLGSGEGNASDTARDDMIAKDPVMPVTTPGGKLMIMGQPIAFVPTARGAVEEVENGYRLSKIRGQIDPNRRGGKTPYARLELTGDLEAAAAEHKIRMTVTGEATEDTRLWLQYSTFGMGSSGWVQHDVSEGPFSVDLEYDVPRMRNDRGDYFGVAPENADVIVTDVELDILD